MGRGHKTEIIQITPDQENKLWKQGIIHIKQRYKHTDYIIEII